MKTRIALYLALSLMCDVALAIDAAQPVDGAADAPSLELLQFLGEWETRDGKWVDPVAFGALTQATDDAGARPEEEGRDEGR